MAWGRAANSRSHTHPQVLLLSLPLPRLRAGHVRYSKTAEGHEGCRVEVKEEKRWQQRGKVHKL